MTQAAADKRLPDTELVIPVCVGTVAFWLGKKASEYHSHKWTVYVRSPNNDDISYFIDKVTFQLHQSFQNPTRVVSKPPFELTETGWGEFEIAVTLHLSPDAQESPVELVHKLRLYSEDEGGTSQSSKKPVVMEQYEELVVWQPHEAFYQRVKAHEPGPLAVPSPLEPYFPRQDETEDLTKITEARQRVAHTVDSLKRQYEAA